MSDGNRAGQQWLSLSLVGQQDPVFLKRPVSCVTQPLSPVLRKDIAFVPLFLSPPLLFHVALWIRASPAPPSRLQFTCHVNVLSSATLSTCVYWYWWSTVIVLFPDLMASAHIYHVGLVSNSSSAFFKSAWWRLPLSPWQAVCVISTLAPFQCRPSFSLERPMCVYRQLNTQSLVSKYQHALHKISGKTGPESVCYFLKKTWTVFKNHQIIKCRRERMGIFLLLFLLIFSTSFV